MLKIYREYIDNFLLIITNSEGVSIIYKAEIKHISKQKIKMVNILFTELAIEGKFLSNKLYDYKNKMKNIKEVIIE